MESGTVMKYEKQYTKWINEESGRDFELPITSLRVDQVPGTHAVWYRSSVDDLEIRHTAHSREGFANGAVLVAEWLPGKKGVLGMNDFLHF